MSDKIKDHIPAIDGLRGLAILLVLIGHGFNHLLDVYSFPILDNLAKPGVFLFFILSAYLLDLKIIKYLHSKKEGNYFWKNYFFRRFLRIYPLYFIVLTIHLSVNMIGYQIPVVDFSEWFLHLILVKGVYIFWSIPVEFKYYFLSPIILLVFYRLHWKLSTILLTILFLICASYTSAYFFELSHVSTWKYLSFFLVGTALSYVKYHSSINSIKYDSQVAFRFAFLILVIFTIILLGAFYFGIDSEEEYLFIFSILSFGSLVYLTLNYNSFQRIFDNKILKFFGRISYSLYLLHMLVLIGTQELGKEWNPIMQFVIWLALTLIIGFVSFRLVEIPLSKVYWKHNRTIN